MNDPMKGISRLVSGRADPFEPTTEEILPNPTTEPQTVETTTLTPQKPVYPNPTVDYSNRTPVEEEKFKKVHAFVLCVVQNGYNCGKELGDIDITKHLGPPQNATDEEVTVSSLGNSTIPEYPSNVAYEQNSELTPFPEITSTLSPENPTYITDDYRTTVSRTYKGHLKIRKNTSKSTNNSTTDTPDLVTISSEQSELPETATESQTTGLFEPEENTLPDDNTTEGTNEKDSISSNTTFEHLNNGKINKIQTQVSDFLSVPLLKYDKVNQRSKNIVTPRPRTLIIVTTTRTTRDVDEEDTVDSGSANDDISEIEPISELEEEDFSSNSDDEQAIAEDFKPEETENNGDDPDTTGGDLTATGNGEESSDDPFAGDVTTTGNGEESSDDPFASDLTATGNDKESSDDPFAGDVTATGNGEESSDDPFASDLTATGNDKESSDDPFAGDVTATGNGEESSDDPFASDLTATGNDKESSDDPFAGDVTTTGTDKKSSDDPFAGDVTTTGDDEESSDEDSKNDKEEETEEEDTKSDDNDNESNNDDKTTTEKSDNDMGITVSGLDDFTVDIDFDDSDFDSMFATSSDRITYKTDAERSVTERSVTVPPILIFGSTPKVATILPTNIVNVNDNTYAPFQTTSTEISVVTEVSVQRSPKQNFNTTKNSDTMFTKARNSLYSLLKLAKEFNID
ncbi:uncharacterized protein isoform X2 [Rhodnius prolixus]